MQRIFVILFSVFALIVVLTLIGMLSQTARGEAVRADIGRRVRRRVDEPTAAIEPFEPDPTAEAGA
jgi:hypothetical protein